MAKAAPSKKTAKAVKAGAAGGKKRKASRTESYSTYIYKVLKQVHPGEFFLSQPTSTLDAPFAHRTSPYRPPLPHIVLVMYRLLYPS
jgi:hypothetical protein